jgi:predicted transposase/invertase (TIGR01784 family)
LLKISKDEVERARLLSEYKYALDTQSKLVDAKRAGRKEGEQKRAFEVAQRLKKRGMAAEQIAEDTGLTLKEVEEL